MLSYRFFGIRSYHSLCGLLSLHKICNRKFSRFLWLLNVGFRNNIILFIRYIIEYGENKFRITSQKIRISRFTMY